MRIVRVDLVGTTDANGNATIKVPLPYTGAWYNVKFSLSTTAPAEWAVLVSGTPVTYGRGRRVTLGPELIQDGETVTISVTTGPQSAAIIGSMNGSAGTPDEMLRTFAPQPNTISVDTAAEVETLVSVRGIANSTTTGIPIPIHANAIGYILAAAGPGFLTSLSITGEQTGIVYISHTAAQTQIGGLSVAYAVLLDPRDTSLKLTVVSGLGAWGPVDVLAWQMPTQQWARQLPGDVFVVSGSGTFTVQEGASPPLWQAPSRIVGQQQSAAGTFTMLAAVVAQTIRVFGWELEIDNQTSGLTTVFIQDGGGTQIAALSLTGAGQNQVSGEYAGAPLPAGANSALIMNVAAFGTTPNVRAFAAVSQG